MRPLRLTPEPEDFVWATGIEDTFVPQTRTGQRSLDEYELMGHYVHWREDLALARELGVQAIRWGVPWYRVEPTPGNFDWRWTDEVIPYLTDELGIAPILDLMHYGCPFWLRREFASEEYPHAVAEYARAVARRYGDRIRFWTPLNEPLVNALMCGRRGLWPPYLRGDQGYVRVLLQLARGIVETVRALESVDPGFTMVHVEAAGLTRAFRAELEVLAVEDQRRGYLGFDLVTGRVRPDHPLFPWMVRNGVSLDALAFLADNPIGLDVIGLNFYPQWSTTQLYVDSRGRLAYRSTEHDGAGFATLLADYHQRYGAPVMVTETSAVGPHEVRSKWLEASVGAVRGLRAAGVPVLGYTWFPMSTMIDWKYRMGRQPVDRYRIELGLFVLDGPVDDDPARSPERHGPRWRATPLVDQFRAYVSDPHASIGMVPAPSAPRRD
jgi:beta-glucosidase